LFSLLQKFLLPSFLRKQESSFFWIPGRVSLARNDDPTFPELSNSGSPPAEPGVYLGANYALQFIPSARAALIFATMPLLTMMLATALGHERLTLAKALGVLLTIAGVGFALGEKAVQRGGVAHEWVGELAVFASALSGAICSVLYRPYLRKYPTLPVSAFAMLASVGFLAALAAAEGFFGSLPHFTAGGWLAVVFIGISSGIGYYLWLWALNHTTPTKVTVFLALSPITAAGLGAFLLGENISMMLFLGLACVVFGLWIAHWDGSCVRRWNPRTAEVLATIEMPVARPTSCAFGGVDFDTLYITSASTRLSSEQLAAQPLAGGVFQCKPGVRGLPMTEFAG
jgi:drug/metabolite transporter (DMT)-like permease